MVHGVYTTTRTRVMQCQLFTVTLYFSVQSDVRTCWGRGIPRSRDAYDVNWRPGNAACDVATSAASVSCSLDSDGLID